MAYRDALSWQVEPEDLISEVRLCALRGHLGIRQSLQSERLQDRGFKAKNH